MSYPVYYVPAGDVLPVLFSTYAGSTGASITMTNFAVTDIAIYKDGGVTQRASAAGVTLLDTDGTDFDTLTGIHGFSIDTGDNTDAGFYTTGAWFHVVVSTVTVDTQIVSFIACAFRIMAAESVAAKPKVDVDAWLGTAAATPTVAGVPEVDVTHFNGTAGTFASGRPEVNTSHVSGTLQTAGDLAAMITTVDDFLDTEIAAIVGYIDTEVAAILALLDDPRTEPGQGAPPVNPDLATKIDYLYKLARNKVTQTSTQLSIFADDALTVDHKATVSDDGTTYTRGELATGP